MSYLIAFIAIVGVVIGFYFLMLYMESRGDGKFNVVIFVLYVLFVQAVAVYMLAIIVVLYITDIATIGFWTYEVWEFCFSLIMLSFMVCYILLSRNEKIHEKSKRKYKFYSYAFLVFSSELVIVYGYLLLVGI